MYTLSIEHTITDYAVWRGAFGRFDELRRAGGVCGYRVRRRVDDERYLVIDLDFPSADLAHAFREVLRRRVWSSSTASPALAGAPRTQVLATVEQLPLESGARRAPTTSNPAE